MIILRMRTLITVPLVLDFIKFLQDVKIFFKNKVRAQMPSVLFAGTVSMSYHGLSWNNLLKKKIQMMAKNIKHMETQRCF